MQHRITTCRRGLVVNGEPRALRLITRFDEWRPSPWRGDEPTDETERRLLRGAAGGHQPAGQYRSNHDDLPTLTADSSRAVRGPFFYPAAPVRRKGVPFLATVVGVGLLLLIAALCIGIAFAPVWVLALILGALR